MPLTPLGLAVAAGGYWLGFHYGPQKVDRVVHAAGLVTLGLVAVTLASVLLGVVHVWLSVRRWAGDEAYELETGATTATGLRLPGFGGWPLLSLRVEWEIPRQVEVTLGRGPGRKQELICPRRRGESPRVVRRLVVADVFGFCRLGLPRGSRERVRVSPARVQVTAHVMSRFLGGDYLSHPTGPLEGEMIEMRRYAHGDPLRHILWKAFARTRKLLVRMPERAINPQPSAAAYMVAGPADEPAASAARFFVQEGLLGQDFLFNADGGEDPTEDPAKALEQIIASVDQPGAVGLERFLNRLDSNRRRNCVLFVPPQPGPWLARVERAAARIPGARVVTAIDDRPGQRGPGRLHRLLFSDRDDPRRNLGRLDRVVARLVACGLEVSVLHRPSGDLLSRAQLEALAGARS